MTGRKKIPLWLILLGAGFALLLGYYLNAAWEPGMDITTYPDALNRVVGQPFENYWNDNTLKVSGIVLLAYIMLILVYITDDRKYMPGKEYGSAKWADPKTVCRDLEDKTPEKNKIFSQNIKMSIDARVTELNNNVLIIGGAGAGKTYREVKPNLLQANSTYIITDPKGEILRSCGQYFTDIGYQVKVVNLVEMSQSDCYNPFQYIRKEADVSKLITNLIANTTPKGANKNDPFWEKSESMYLQSLFYYVWMEMPEKERNFNSLLDLLAKAEVKEDEEGIQEESELDEIMNALAEEKGENHPAVQNYRKVTRGAADTVRSIIISANSRMAPFANPQLKRILSKDDMDIPFLGVGVNGDGKTKTALFCVIPDVDKTYNFVVGMLYTQIFQELYYQADFNYEGALPIQVAFWLDEFANVALPDDFCSLLSTMRSRGISSNIIIQNLAQIKALFEKTWETIPGNCDTIIYLGGNEQSTHKYISEELGKVTITKKSQGISKGKNGSSSQNIDVIGRELMTADEIRKMPRSKCIIFVSGRDPILDNKCNTRKHPKWDCIAKGNYVHTPGEKDNSSFCFLNSDSLKYYETCEKKGDNVHVIKMTAEEFLQLSEEQCYNQVFLTPEDRKELEEEREADEQMQEEPDGEDSLTDAGDQEENEKNNDIFPQKAVSLKPSIVERMAEYEFSGEQLDQMHLGLDHGLPEEEILTYFRQDYEANKMEQIRLVLEQLKQRKNVN